MSSPDAAPKSGRRGDYYWFESAELPLYKLLSQIPEVARGRHVAVTAFDSGPLRLSEEEKASGWRSVEGVAVSPLVDDPEAVPNDQFDEWYIFEALPPVIRPEVFVNYVAFSLQDPALLAHYYDLPDLQERFWQQLAAIRPESYLAEGSNLICVTR